MHEYVYDKLGHEIEGRASSLGRGLTRRVEIFLRPGIMVLRAARFSGYPEFSGAYGEEGRPFRPPRHR